MNGKYIILVLLLLLPLHCLLWLTVAHRELLFLPVSYVMLLVGAGLRLLWELYS
jgi:hypothetical protein